MIFGVIYVFNSVQNTALLKPLLPCKYTCVYLLLPIQETTAQWW